MKLSVCVPAYNEEENLETLHARLVSVLEALTGDFEIVFVDDGSGDRSLAIMRELSARDARVRYVSFSRNFGHEIATSAALDVACGDAVVLIDADLQDPPEVIPALVDRWKQGAQVVYGRRRRREVETWFKRATSYVFYRLLNRLTDVPIPPDTGDFRLMDRRVVEALRRFKENPRFMRGLVSWVGFRQDAVLYDRHRRHAGRTKYNLIKLMRLSWEAICSFSLVPLRVMTWVGAIVTVLSLAKAAHVAGQKIIWGIDIPGYALVACGIFFLGGVQLVLLGVLAQYVGQIYRFTQDRPLYIVAEHGGGARNDPAGGDG
jgi:dolichol-phosphate mannosyltransferase